MTVQPPSTPRKAPPVPELPARLSPRSRRAQEAGERPMGTLAEVFADNVTDGSATAFMLAHLDPARGPVLWVQDRLSLREAGRPCIAGMPEGLDILHLSVSRPVDVLWALEQGLGTAGLSAVVGEVWGDPQVLDFTASKRLALRAEAHGLPCWLIRRAAHPNLSAARERWRLATLPSAPHGEDKRAPGAPIWKADLFRARWRAPGAWVARIERGELVLNHGVEADGCLPQAMEATA